MTAATTPDSFRQRLATARRRLEELSRRETATAAQRALWHEALREIFHTLDDLRASAAELHAKNVQLATAEEALRRERDFAEGLIETAQVIVLVLDTSGRIVRFNPYMEEISGYRLHEVLGEDWFATFLPKRDHPRIRRLLSVAVAGEPVRGNVNPIVTKDGSERDIEWYSKTLKDASGTVVGILSIGQDITESLQAERRRAAQYAVTRVLSGSTTVADAIPKLLQTICEGVECDLGELWLLDRDTNLLRWDSIWHGPTVDATEFVAVSSAMTLPPGVGLPANVWSSGQPVWMTDLAAEPLFLRTSVGTKIGLRAAFAFPIRSRDADIGVMMFFSRAARPPDDDLLQLMGALGRQIGDFIERNRIQEQLREAEQLAHQQERLADFGVITAKILHDIGNPLAGLSMLAQLIVRRAERDPSQPVRYVLDQVKQIVAEVRRLDRLVTRFRTFRRERRLNLAPVHIGSMLQGIVDLWRPVAATRSIALTLALSDPQPLVMADEEKLRRLFDNLIKNAVEAIDSGPGCIRIRVDAAAAKVRVSVEDTGPGIPESLEVFRLFETTKEHGSGLGLAIVQEIVEAHRGSIAFAAMQPHGTVFHVELPSAVPR